MNRTRRPDHFATARRRTLLVALTCSLALLASACGGDSEPDDAGADIQTGADAPSPGTSFELVDPLVSAVDALTTSADGDPIEGMVALLVAMDRGYALDVVLGASAEGRLDADRGAVLDEADDLVEPSGSDGGVLADKPALQTGTAMATRVRFARSSGQQAGSAKNMGEFLDNFAGYDIGFGAGTPPQARPDPWEGLTFEQYDKRLKNLILVHLLRSGVPLERVVEAIVFAEKINCTVNEGDRPIEGQALLVRSIGGCTIGEQEQQDAAGPSQDADADVDSPGAATYRVQFGPADVSSTLGDLESGTLAVSVDGDEVTLDLDVMFHIFLAGGPDPQGRNCEADIIETATGTGPAGSGAIELTVVTSQTINITGSQCDGGGDEFYVMNSQRRQEQGARATTFEGDVDSSGIEGVIYRTVEIVGGP